MRYPKNVKDLTQEEYEELILNTLKLEALEDGGVDNWDWYDLAMDNYRAARDEWFDE